MSKHIYNELDRTLDKLSSLDLPTLLELMKKTTFDKDDIINVLNQSFFLKGYFTPRELALLIIELGRIKKPNSIIDICCGVGNILSYCDYGKEWYGIDNNRNVIEIAKMLNSKPTFYFENVLSKNFKKNYDLVIGDFPFGQRIETGGKVHQSEYLFIKKGLSILNNNGLLLCLVPQSFLFGSSKFIKNLRNEILSKYNLELILHLPAGIFLQNTRIRCALLGISNSQPSKTTHISEYTKSIDKILIDFINSKSLNKIPQESIVDRWDKEYFNPEFKSIEEKLKGKEVKKLCELANIYRGYSALRSENPQVIELKYIKTIPMDKYLLLGGRNINHGLLKLTDYDRYIDKINKPSFSRAILKPGDIIISMLFSKRNIYIYKKDDPRAVANNSCAIIRSPDKNYLYTYFQSKEGQDLFIKQTKNALKGATIPGLTIKDLENIKIPILPLDNLNKVEHKEIWNMSKEESIEFLFVLKELKQQPKYKNIAETIEQFIEDSNNIKSLINKGESKNLEFKQTYRWDIRNKKINKDLLYNIAKVCASFCNTEGGTLLIGVTDNGDIYGIEREFPNDDAFLKHFTDSIIKSKLKLKTNNRVDPSIVETEDNKICQVNCMKRDEPVYFDNQLFIRRGPTSSALPLKEVVNYVNKHFREIK